MKIGRNELKIKYGIDLPKGKYSIKQNVNEYEIYTIKDDTDGCPLVGKNTEVGRVTDSKATFTMLMNKYLNPARKRKEKVFITIK